MKTLIIISTLLFLTSSKTSAQAAMDTANNWPQNSTEVTNSDPVYTVVEEMPSFRGGEDAMFKYIADNIKYPSEAREKNITGKVFVTFVVDNTGKVKDAKVLRGIGGGCDEESVRVVSSMPDWIPGKQNGKTVSVQYNLPIHFTMNEKKNPEKK